MKMKKMLLFAMSVFLSVLLINTNVAFASVVSQGKQMFIEGAEEVFETLSEQEFPTLMPQEDKGELSKLKSLEAEAEGEFSKADKEDMLVESQTEYDVWVKNIRVNSDNKDDVLGDGGSIKYEPANGEQRAKLTLNNLRAEDNTSRENISFYEFIVASEDIDLILKGDNIINITAAEGEHTDNLECIFGIRGNGIYCDGDGSLSININAETKLKQLRELWGINSTGSSLSNVTININIHGYAKIVRGIYGLTNINNATINIDSHVGYNEKLGEHVNIGSIALIKSYIREDININSSDISLNIKPREGLEAYKAELFGIAFDFSKLNISGDNSISTKGTDVSIAAEKLDIKDKYKIDLIGPIVLTDSDNAGINFEDISPVSYFTVRDEIWGEVLVCNPDVADGTAKFSVPDEATVLAGDSEENAKSIVKDELNNLYYYEANRSAHPNIKYVKVAYKRNISFNDGGGSGSMADVEYVEGSKYTLPECTFTPPTSKQFKVWEVFGMQYAPGTEIVVDEDTVVTAIWEDKPFEGGGSGGSGSGGSGGGSDSGGSGSGGSGGSRGGSGGGSSRGGVAKGGAQSPAKQPGSWMQDPFGWWYKNADGSYPKGTWQQIDSVWYAFNDAGYMLTGWHSLGGCWYYLNTSGAMSTGWVEVSGKWYYFNANGAMSTAWIEVNGKWYYLEPTGREDKPQGSLYISENTPDGYPVNELGEWVR